MCKIKLTYFQFWHMFYNINKLSNQIWFYFKIIHSIPATNKLLFWRKKMRTVHFVQFVVWRQSKSDDLVSVWSQKFDGLVSVWTPKSNGHRYERLSPMVPVWRQIIIPFLPLENWHFHKNEPFYVKKYAPQRPFSDHEYDCVR